MPTVSKTAANAPSTLTANQKLLIEMAEKGPVELSNSKLTRTAKSLVKRDLGAIEGNQFKLSPSSEPSKPSKADKTAKNKKQPAPTKDDKPNTKTTKRSKQSSAERILDALNNSPSGLDRNGLREATGIQKGYSKLLGSPTKDDVGGMEGDGLVKSQKIEGTRSLVYVITAKGKKLLESMKAE